MDLIFDIPRLRRFIGRAKGLEPFNEATIEFYDEEIWISIGFSRRFTLRILCERPDWQLSSMVQIFGQQLPLLSNVEQLEISQHHQANIEWISNLQ